MAVVKGDVRDLYAASVRKRHRKKDLLAHGRVLEVEALTLDRDEGRAVVIDAVPKVRADSADPGVRIKRADEQVDLRVVSACAEIDTATVQRDVAAITALGVRHAHVDRVTDLFLAYLSTPFARVNESLRVPPRPAEKNESGQYDCHECRDQSAAIAVPP